MAKSLRRESAASIAQPVHAACYYSYEAQIAIQPYHQPGDIHGVKPKKRKGIGPKARVIYDADIRHLVEPEHHGEYLALDVETGEYEIDGDDLAGNLRMLEFHSPENLFTLRIGYPAFGAFVGWSDLTP